jgi:hypothetical protein
MGIFDDAIREHLDLKRRHGADEDEVQQLEDEAFGLPARPGDPDFPETGEAEVAGDGAAAPSEALEEAPPAEAPAAGEAPPMEAPSTESPAAEAPPIEAPPTEAPAAEAPPTEAPPPEAPAPEETAEAPTVEPAGAPHPEPTDEAPPHGDPLLQDEGVEPEPPAAAQETPVEDPGASSFTTTEREAIADQPTEFFDQAPAALELDELDLDLEEEAEGSDEEPLTGEEPVEDATPVDELEVVEDTEPAADEAAEPDDEPPDDGEAEDVLEETPEFLRENPDDDELWFEQGEPKDFDF